MSIDPEVLGSTRRSLHAVGEHVLGAALFQGRHRIGLRQFTGGFSTQNYLHIRDGAAVERRAMVVGTDLVVRDDDLNGGTIEERAPITTLRDAGRLVDVEPGLSGECGYTPGPLPDLDEPQPVDPEAAAFLAELTAIGYAALVILTAHYVDEDPAEIQLWPEHFDLATHFAEVNYGLSPGDEGHPHPYVYVGPWTPPAQGGFWNEPFGASLTLESLPTVDEVLTFFGKGHELASDL
ncbi:MAG TPA: hypothetical protein VD926_00920 [Acidimicrobiales bacterium]|nr:hypothetical protein [Acidimicrobiales bacterium]